MKRRISPVIEPPGKIVEVETNCSKFTKVNKAGVAVPFSSEFNTGATITDVPMEWAEEWPNLEFDGKDRHFTLDLSSWKQCKVLNVEQLENKRVKVILEDKRCKEKAVCHLLHPWNTIEGIEPGLTVSVLATKEHANSEHFIVNTDCGFFVTDPDILVSGTTVMNSLFCQRRGVLQELFRIPGLENAQMVIGTLAHCIFQRCLLDKSCKSLTDVQTIAEHVMKSRKIISSLYAAKMSVKEAFCLIDPYLKEIETFIKTHLHLRLIHKIKPPADSDKISICEIIDIEENIWCHQLGIKGRIDATVSVARDNVAKHCETMPLELKTGSESKSFEHIGQLALYEMMMELVGHDVSAGLLVYLREGKCRRVASNRNMKRDLIMLRNEVSRFFSVWMVTNENGNTGLETTLPLKPTLPAPINNERACAKCQYSTVCAALSKREHEFRISGTSHKFTMLAETACEHLRNSDIDYFIRWTGLIYLEVKESAQSHSARNIWNLTPKERSENGWCIAGLTLLTPVHAVEDQYFHTFSLNLPSNGFDPDAGKENTVPQTIDSFQAGEYIVCSTNKRIAVASGHVISYAGNALVVSFERDLSVNYSGEQFILDKNASVKLSCFDLSNLAMLLNNDEAGARIRRIIIDREIATFSDGILCKSMIPKAKEILKQLNRHQKEAALKAAAAETYCLLKGLPGTGKTQTIIGLIRLLSLLGQSVLLTSNTHSAVDNILKRLLPFPELSFIRLGPMDRIDPSVRSFAEPILAENCDSPEKLAELYGKFQIVAATCMATGHALISERVFDYCIVDEATQVFQASIIRPLLRCKKFLLVGDPEQLPPVVKSASARSLGAAESLFHRLDQEGSYFILPKQYRMNRVLTKLANEFTYNGKLICGNDVVANATLKLPNLPTVRRIYEVERWLMKTISNQIDLSAVIVNTGNTYKLNINYQELNETTSSLNCRNRFAKNLMKYTNISEVALVVYICQALLQAGVKLESIGIIAPFRAQVDLIQSKVRRLASRHQTSPFQGPLITNVDMLGSEREKVENSGCTIEVNTVDQYQGKDKKIIIFSCTKSIDPATVATDYNAKTDSSANEILNDKRRLTVAITRAQEKFIIIGDRTTLDSYSTFKMLFNVASKASHIHVVDKKDGFEWTNAFELLTTLSE
ncbi:DNA replication ATP-dependent helicase/nuclease DNA2 [Anopheles marshallii]|uniref:DNA replication ATP-dependent helicase/nuclease DNA2 n=1 Tax=Anopheles marshallii TaxID=1521116 RepID=UPI00237A5B5B|nr:DNA replication ATP-dependent helicase/nuclease DNA2 [Anopheles marshallii]